MTRDETVALWQKCEKARTRSIRLGKPDNQAHEAAKAIWNVWAEPLVKKLAELKKERLYKVISPQPKEFIAPRLVPANVETTEFFRRALVDFSDYTFKGVADFSGFVFPGSARFERVGYSHTSGDAAKFADFARFEAAAFMGDARFCWVNFKGSAAFNKTHFFDDVSFDQAIFESSVWFQEAKFEKDAWFGQIATFNYANFVRTKFHAAASFRGLKATSAFDLTGASFIKLVPDFRQADFKQAPDLDDISIPTPSWEGGQRDNILRYRALRRLAIQGHDHENEAKAFKGEVRSKRGTEHNSCHAAFWYGLAYDALSDFGRSMSRPFVIWFASLFAFAAVYLGNAGVSKSEWFRPCAADGPPKALKAVTLSITNALPGIGSSRSEETKAFQECLGLQHAPVWSSIIQVGQTLWSTVLIFLFLLAVRNQFKIK
jgi:uncharacterized protein YjbI with pentapeptide repeats